MATGGLARTAGTFIVCGLLLVLCLPAALTYPYDPQEDSQIRLIGSWRDPGGKGADLAFEMNRDMTRLLLVGFGAPGEVWVSDLDLSNATVLEPPSPGFFARGAGWSYSEERIVVWGENEDGSPIALYDLPSYDLNTTATWLDLVTLPEVTEVSFFAGDAIVSISGRDAEGTSHLMFIETLNDAIRVDHVWEGNHTIIEVTDNNKVPVILDSGGTVTFITDNNWNEFKRYPDALRGGVTSWNIPWEHRWAAGDGEGRLVVSDDGPYDPRYNITVGDGPVTGFAWTLGRTLDFVTALRLPGGGSLLDGWHLFSGDREGEAPEHLCSLAIEGNVTMMGQDPRGWSRVLVAMDDGTLASYVLDIRPDPVTLNEGDPDDPDGRGLEPFAAWHMEGTPDDVMRFSFNHAGSLIALQGFGGHNDLRVLNRTFDLVAEIPVPGDDFELTGFEWSSTDRWLIYWGTFIRSEGRTFEVRAFDVPTFDKSKSFDTGKVLDVTHAIWDALFLPGDQVLAMCCAIGNTNYVMTLLDLTTGEVLSENLLPGGRYDMSWDGDNIVLYSDQGGIWTVSPPYMEFNRTQVGPTAFTKTMAVNGSSGWCHVDWQYNVTVMNGTPREEVFGFDMVANIPRTVTWTSVPGDLVLGSERLYKGSTIQLWRLEMDGEEGDWRSVGGARMITELNSSRTIKQIEADPAFPGLVAASFDDGTLALYHLNLTPYPAAPEELGGLGIDPYIPPPDGGNGNGGTDRGSDGTWMFPVALVASIAVLLTLLVVLRAQEGKES